MLLLLSLLACKDATQDTAPLFADADQDGFNAADDCDDDNASVYPGASEVCDGLDNDCDGTADNGASDAVVWYQDADGDGFGDTDATLEACTVPAGYSAVAGDCDDSSIYINPGAVEDDCTDPVDYNCDGSVGYADADGDGVPACEDCDDSDAARLPGGVEICDELDNDCDGQVDNDASDASTWYIDHDTDGFGSSDYTLAACAQPLGYVDNDQDCDDNAEQAFPGGVEVCDGLDNDCDGNIDPASASDAATWYADNDSDGFGDPSTTQIACEEPTGYSADASDCDDSDADVNPDGTELCDGQDNDCDGDTDEDSAADASTWYIDYDSDGYGSSSYSLRGCEAPSGYVSTTTDCDDTDSSVNPVASEVCDGVDNDCDGVTDPTSAVDAGTWYLDADLDGYGDAGTSYTGCEQPSGYLEDDSDCDDADSAVSPDAEEVCDSVDNNCDGTVDEDSATDASTWYLDSDGDGYGDASATTAACDQPSGYVSDDTDCDDSDSSVGNCYDCDVTALGSPSYQTSRSLTYGQWMQDPLETLGSGIVWEMSHYTGSTVTEYPSLADFQAQTSGTTTTLPYAFNGTGATVYDGYLYYNAENSNTLVEVDLATGAVNSTLTLTGAGYRNTYHYQWGGWSDIDFAVDENGLWVIYATAANSGRIVVSSLDTQPLSVVDTWNTNSDTKTSVGNAFMVCGVLYASDRYNGSSTTLDYKYDTADSTDSAISISFSQNGYNSHMEYNPATGEIRSWDNRQLYTYAVSY
ncbi:MAG: MopE-related protein [Myxococcota bacterium]|nr:MopE-related protein [Myxococcota bacterium]